MDFDFETARKAVELVKSSGTAIGSAISTINAVKEQFASTDKQVDSGITKAVYALEVQIRAAELTNLDLQDAIIQLRKENLDLHHANDKFAGYELVQTPKAYFVYRSPEGVKPVH